MSERELPSRLDANVGKAYCLLHALIDRGLVKMRIFRRSDRKPADVYDLTPNGLAEKAHRTRRFLLRKEAAYRVMALTISALHDELAADSSRSALPVVPVTPGTTKREGKTNA